MEISGFLVVFLSQDSDTAKTSGLAECAKAVSKTNLGSMLLMLTCMKPRLLRLQKSTNESSGGVGVELGTAGPGLGVRLKAIQTGRSKFGTESKRSSIDSIDSRHSVQTKVR